MNREDIIKLAREAGFDHWWDSGNEQRETLQEHIERFAALVAAAEREACAKVCDETLAQHYMKQTIPERDEALFLAACADCASAIRARGG